MTISNCSLSANNLIFRPLDLWSGNPDFPSAVLTRVWESFLEQSGLCEKSPLTLNSPKDCAPCALKTHCTKAEHQTVSRWEHEASLERVATAMPAASQKLAQRKTSIEHCWRTLKWLLPGGFLGRGKIKAGAEVSLTHLGYNRKRALVVVGLEKLLKSLKEFNLRGSPSPTGRVNSSTPFQTTMASIQ